MGPGTDPGALAAMGAAQRHRGPDSSQVVTTPSGAALGHERLRIVDLSPTGEQPMVTADGRYWITFNGEVYNHVELRSDLGGHEFRGSSDTEIVLAAFARWGEACLERFLGMFAFVVWDEQEQRLFAARDRFGVKPLHHSETSDGGILLASEVGALLAAGVPGTADDAAWATYLATGRSDAGPRTFHQAITSLPAGHVLRWHAGRTEIEPWYDLVAATGPDTDDRTDATMLDEYAALLRESVALRLRSDVPVGVNLSGGLDSSLLLALVDEAEGAERAVTAFTFVTDDERYDELPWVEAMVQASGRPLTVSRLDATDVPGLAGSVHRVQQAPFGGVPTLAYAHLCEVARSKGVEVLLDGQGLDEQWAGYDYYQRAVDGDAPVVQGAADPAVRPDCLRPEFAAAAEEPPAEAPFADPLRDLQFRDLCRVKLPRALRYNDRASMWASTELREPFLDHRLVELALRQPASRKVRDGTGKWGARRLAAELVPAAVHAAPKRPVQTPQREWLRGPLRGWATEMVTAAIETRPDWFDADATAAAWQRFAEGRGDNSHFVWQWVSVGLAATSGVPAAGHAGP